MYSRVATVAVLSARQVVDDPIPVPTLAPAMESLDSTMTAMQRLLLTIDIVVSGMAVVLLTLGILWWVVRSRRDPLGDVPARPNRIQEDSILLAALGYMTAIFVLGGFIPVLGLEEGLIAVGPHQDCQLVAGHDGLREAAFHRPRHCR